MWLTLIVRFLKTMAKKIPWQVYACAGAVIWTLVFGALCYHRGKAETQKEWDLSVERGKARIKQLEKDSLVVNMIVDTKWRERIEYVYSKGDTIVRQIPVYIPQGTPDLPGGFRVLHDAAVSSKVPGTSGGVEAAPVPVTTATETIVQNYTGCLVIREEVVAWRQWYQEQSQLWNSAGNK